MLSEFDISTTIAKQNLKLNNLRLTLVFVKSNDSWPIEHKHISLPTDAHDNDEAYPVKELEERMVVLQKLVEEKTEELKVKNNELKSALANINY
ncbi:MAG: nuclear transport factor 2 family protein [Bacteroidetes bacterium]|nr:nuclear transport factor 2 family protein [Bacteroidota bacterium]